MASFSLNMTKEIEVGVPLRGGTHKSETCIVALSSTKIKAGEPVFIDSDTAEGTTLVKSAATGAGKVKGIVIAKDFVNVLETENFEPGEAIEVRTFGELAVESADSLAIGDVIYVKDGKFTTAKTQNKVGFVKNSKISGTNIFILDIEIKNNVIVSGGGSAASSRGGANA